MIIRTIQAIKIKIYKQNVIRIIKNKKTIIKQIVMRLRIKNKK